MVEQSIPTDSAPRPDGFGSSLYLMSWAFIKEDLIEAAMEFFTGATLPRFLITSYIVLIPKVENPTSYEKF